VTSEPIDGRQDAEVIPISRAPSRSTRGRGSADELAEYLEAEASR
jgi:hypothetical protein